MDYATGIIFREKDKDDLLVTHVTANQSDHMYQRNLIVCSRFDLAAGIYTYTVLHLATTIGFITASC